MAQTICPFALYQPVKNESGPRSAKLGFVQHCEVGNGSCYEEFNNSASQASAHFQILKSGQLLQFVPIDRIAWAEMAGNGEYISCEFEGQITEPLTASQLAAGAKLIAWCAEQDGFPLVVCDHGGHGVTVHCHWQPPNYPSDPSWGNHSCPGPGPRLAQHLTLIQMAIAISEGKDPEDEDDMPTALIGKLLTDGTPEVIAIPPPSGGGANWGPAWFSIGVDYVDVSFRVAVHGTAGWRLEPAGKPLVSTAAGGRSGFALQAGDDKLSITSCDPVAVDTPKNYGAVPAGYLLEYAKAPAPA